MGTGTIEGMAWGRTDRTPPRLCRTLQSDDYALNELPQPHVVLACGFLIAKPDPCTLST